jgi:hypothetical protein
VRAVAVPLLIILLAANTEPHWQVLNHAARQALQAKDYGKLRETLRELKVDGNKKPVSHSGPAFALAERVLIPEDIAYDAKTRRFFASSVRKTKIITADGRDFAKSDWPVLALRVDSTRRILWAATG